MKVACFSVAAVDFFPQQDKHFAGGNSLNQAVRYVQLGHQSAFLGALGMDQAGDRIAALMQHAGIDVSHLYRLHGETACNRIINDEAGERYGIEGAWDGGVYQEFELGSADWDYMSGFDVWATHANGPNYPAALQRKSSSQFMSVDFLHLKDYDLLRKSMGIADIAFFGGTEEMSADLAQLAKESRTLLVLTLGAAGSIAFDGERSYAQPALPLEKVIDTTGCGDAYQAGFSATYYATRDIRASLLAGAELGRQAARTFGGIPWE